MSEIQTTRITVGVQGRDFTYRPQSSDEAVMQQTFTHAELELYRLQRWEEIMRFVSAAPKPLIVDCGAYIGTTAVYFALRYPHAGIVAIEPDDDNFKLLEHNTQGLTVRCVKAGVSNVPGQSWIEKDADHMTRHRLVPQENGPVSMIAINDIYRHHDDCTPFIVKVDIEGGEKELFLSNTEWIDRTPIIIMEPHDWLYPKEGACLPFLIELAGRPRDLIIKGEYLISIAHDLGAA
jgi:FkbM family methyltransferase